MYSKEISIKKDKTLGYLYFMDKSHPLGDKKGRVWHHRHVASIKIGRWLKSYEVVHHIDGNKANNSQDNLDVLYTTMHNRMHFGKAKNYSTDKNYTEISYCKVCGNVCRHYSLKTCSIKCSSIATRKVKDRPSPEELKVLLANNTLSNLGASYGVSPNIIKKWAKQYGIWEPRRSR